MSDYVIDLTSALIAGALNDEKSIQAAELIFGGRSRRGEGGDEIGPIWICRRDGSQDIPLR